MGTGTGMTLSVYERHCEELAVPSIQGESDSVALGRISGAQHMSVMGTYSPDVNRRT